MATAIILARGGSRGVKRKNLAKIGGVPLIVRAIRTCLDATTIDVVAVSSDDGEILSVAHDAGAELITRPLDLCSDETPTAPALIHACETLPVSSDVFVYFQCTAPTATADEVDEVAWALEESDADVATVTCRTDAVYCRSHNGQLVDLDGQPLDPITRRQDRDELYEIAGSAWAIRRESFLRRGKIYGGRTVGVVVDRHRLEIDTARDLALARCIVPYPGME